MWGTSILESIDVILHSRIVGIERRVELSHSLAKQFIIVHTLCSGEDLLTAHEHVVGVRELGVACRWHCVEWANLEWELVEDVEVGAVLLKDQLAKMLLLRGAVTHFSIGIIRFVGRLSLTLGRRSLPALHLLLVTS
jgi:hypothetical protein